MLKHSPASHARANDCFEQAMALDPHYAEPHASLGLNCFLSGMSGLRSARETMPLVRAEAKEALSLDPSDPGPHFLLASVAAAYQYRLEAGRRTLRHRDGGRRRYRPRRTGPMPASTFNRWVASRNRCLTWKERSSAIR